MGSGMGRKDRNGSQSIQILQILKKNSHSLDLGDILDFNRKGDSWTGDQLNHHHQSVLVCILTTEDVLT